MINFELVTGGALQIELLYTLLFKRKHNISHSCTTSFEEHTEFVKNHPYRAWYLIKNSDEYIGTIYLLDSNCIGINIVKLASLAVPLAIDFIFDNYQPSPEIKSIRPSDFYINVSPNNTALLVELESIGASKIQETFSLFNRTNRKIKCLK